MLRTIPTDLGSLALVPAKKGRTSPSCVSALPGIAWEARRQLFKDILPGSGGASVGVRRDQRADIPVKPRVGELLKEADLEPCSVAIRPSHPMHRRRQPTTRSASISPHSREEPRLGMRTRLLGSFGATDGVIQDRVLTVLELQQAPDELLVHTGARPRRDSRCRAEQ